MHILKKGEELHEQLNIVASEYNLSSAWMNGIGGASSVTLGFYNPETRQYQWQDFDEPLEIISLQGNLVITDGQPLWHIHGTFGRSDYTTISGHVKLCVIGLTGELSITPIDASLTRKYDDETGLNLIASID